MKYKALIVLMVGLVLVLSLYPAASQASSPLVLPPRPEDPNCCKVGEEEDDGQPAGAYIILHAAQGATTGVWTVVQWQDSAGGWHDVEGWRGTLDGHDIKSWWVHPKDFGTGPFRWLVSQGEGGKLLATSDSFYLPDTEGETLWVEVSLTE